MIDRLDQLPELTRSWLEPLRSSDPERYAELAASMVISEGGDADPNRFPAAVDAVIGALDLRGKEIGAFRFAPIEGASASARITAYDRHVRQWFDPPTELIFVGEYGPGGIFASPQGIGLFDPDQGRITALTPDFETFLLVQANAYDAYKAHLVKRADLAGYEARLTEVEALPRFSKSNAAAIFEAQRVS